MNLIVLAASFTEIRPALIFWTLLTFAIVAIVLRWKAWGPILALVDEREKQIQNWSRAKRLALVEQRWDDLHELARCRARRPHETRTGGLDTGSTSAPPGSTT